MKRETGNHYLLRNFGYLYYRLLCGVNYTLEDKMRYDRLCASVLTKDERSSNRKRKYNV